jgi:pilus assembly protein CpaE
MMETRILLAADAAFEDRLRAAMPELNGNLSRWDGSQSDLECDGARRLADAAPEVIAFGPELATASVLAVAGELDRIRPDIEIIVVAEPSPVMWERAARAGVRELVSPLAPDDELSGAVRRAAATVEERRLARPALEPVPTTPVSTTPVSTPKLVVVRSPKGGSGKTMVASNLAVTLAKDHPGDVALVDLDLQFGDVATSLGLRPEHTVADATENDELTPTGLKALLSVHASQLYVLCAPEQPGRADDVTGSDVAALLGLLTAAFRFVVVDTGGGLDEHTLAALEAATDVVVVCSMDVSSVRAVRKEIDALDSVDLAPANRHHVLNRSNSRVGLDERDIERTIGSPIAVRIPSARAVPLNMNCGGPVVQAEPSAPVTRQIRELAARIVPPVEAPRRRWRTWR